MPELSSCAPDTGDTAWVMVATVLVLGMIPGLAFFEAGLLRSKNSVSVITQCLGGLVCCSCLWIIIGYSLTFGGDTGGVIGNFSKVMFISVNFNDCGPTLPIAEAAGAIFQMMFACVTPLLITGTVAERMAWGPYLTFTCIWEVLVYYPVAHWIWGNGWLDRLGTQDFAGGLVIHTTSGIASIIIAAMLGRRHEYDKYHGEFPHSDLRLATVGAAFLWIGWFGFNAGSAMKVNEVAMHAVINTQVGACFGGVVWLILGWIHQKPSAFYILNGAIAGMAGITPASGYISVPSAVVLAIILGVSSFFAVKLLQKARIDDALEVSCVHGVTGAIGALAIGFVGDSSINPDGKDGLFLGGGGALLGWQVLGVVICLAYPALMTTLILLVIKRVTPLRAALDHEIDGLDYHFHGLDVIHLHDKEFVRGSSSAVVPVPPDGKAVKRERSVILVDERSPLLVNGDQQGGQDDERGSE